MKNQTALLVIDLQKESGFHLERFDDVVRNASLVISAARDLAIPVIYTRHVNDANGLNLVGGEPVDEHGRPVTYRADTLAIEIIDELAAQTGDLIIDKNRYSAFHGTSLNQELRQRNIKKLVVLGVLTDVCVMTSLFDAYQHDYELAVVADACTATTLAAHYSALLILSNWIYGLEIFNSTELLKGWNGEPAHALKTVIPDHFSFQPPSFVETIAHFNTRLTAK